MGDPCSMTSFTLVLVACIDREWCFWIASFKHSSAVALALCFPSKALMQTWNQGIRLYHMGNFVCWTADKNKVRWKGSAASGEIWKEKFRPMMFFFLWASKIIQQKDRIWSEGSLILYKVKSSAGWLDIYTDTCTFTSHASIEFWEFWGIDEWKSQFKGYFPCL